LTATLDVYQITIKDRIVGSGALYGSGGSNNSPAVIAAILANGNILDPTVSQTGVNIFANGLDTRTRGADLTLTNPNTFSWGRLDLSLAANYNKTEVTKIRPPPAQLAPQGLFDATAISDLETTSPRARTIFGALWSLGGFSVNLHETVYGKSSELQSPNGGTYYRTQIGTVLTTDLELGYQNGAISLALGAHNLFNRYPNGLNPDLLAIYRATLNTTAVRYYPDFSPIGIDGGYYYARLSYNF
jgi:iron complex outermembrane recepter protein